MYFHFGSMQICFFSKWKEFTKLWQLKTIQVYVHHFGFVIWISSQVDFAEISHMNSVMFVNSQLVCLPPVGIFKPVMFIWNICFLQFEWHACELASVAKRMTTINKHLTFFDIWHEQTTLILVPEPAQLLSSYEEVLTSVSEGITNSKQTKPLGT